MHWCFACICMCEGVNLLEVEFTDSCDRPCGFWELKHGSCGRLSVLLTTQPTLQPHGNFNIFNNKNLQLNWGRNSRKESRYFCWSFAQRVHPCATSTDGNSIRSARPPELCWGIWKTRKKGKLGHTFLDRHSVSDLCQELPNSSKNLEDSFQALKVRIATK